MIPRYFDGIVVHSGPQMESPPVLFPRPPKDPSRYDLRTNASTVAHPSFPQVKQRGLTLLSWMLGSAQWWEWGVELMGVGRTMPSVPHITYGDDIGGSGVLMGYLGAPVTHAVVTGAPAETSDYCGFFYSIRSLLDLDDSSPLHRFPVPQLSPIPKPEK